MSLEIRICVLVVFFGALSAGAQNLPAPEDLPEPEAAPHKRMPNPREDLFLRFALEELKAGEFVRYRSDGIGGETEYFFACVLVEANWIWIESDYLWLLGFPGTRILYQVSRKDSLIFKAWWGKPGEEGELVALRRQRKQDDREPDRLVPGTLEKGASVTLAGQEWRSERQSITYELESPHFGKALLKSTESYSVDVPFKIKANIREQPLIYGLEVKWDVDPDKPAGLLQSEHTTEYPDAPEMNRTLRVELLEVRRDAVQTIKIPEIDKPRTK